MSQVLGVLWQTAKTAVSGAARHGSVAPKGSHSHLLRWIMSFGGLGLFVIALVDSSVIPIPLPGSADLLLLLLTSQRGSTAWSAVWLAVCTFCGSMIGGYLAWGAGRKGGEVALGRYVPKRFLGRITGWMEKHGALSVGIATILPPPVPLMPFVVASGALGVSRGQFLVFYSIARVPSVWFPGLVWRDLRTTCGAGLAAIAWILVDDFSVDLHRARCDWSHLRNLEVSQVPRDGRHGATVS